jgi:type IX secretion system PorP/SprF family membrane protein
MKLLFKTSYRKLNLATRFYLLVITIVAGSLSGASQDVHLTQYDYSPLLLNSAHTGNFYGNWRAALNYRNQWAAIGTPYSTAVISGDVQLKAFGKKIGIGGILINNASNGLTNNMIYASGSYFHSVKENNFSVGLQLGFISSSPSTESWYIWNEADRLFNAPNNEDNNAERTTYPDIKLGFLWMRKYSIFEPEAGISLAHLNTPNISVLNSTEKLGITSTVHAKVKTIINDEFYLTPTFLYANNTGSSLSVFGINAGYNLLGNRSSVKEIFGGLYVRNGITDELSDVSLLLGATVGRLDIILNYDVNIGGLSQSKNISSFEISLIYKSISTILNSYSIPCERF